MPVRPVVIGICMALAASPAAGARRSAPRSQLVLGLSCGERRGRDAGAAVWPACRRRGSPRRCGRSAPGQRPGTIMPRLAKGFSDDEIAALAAWYAAQPAP